jgi:hypothetical protein
VLKTIHRHIASSHHFVMQSQPAESQLSLDLLEDSDCLDGHTQGSSRAEYQASPDLLDPSQLTDAAGSPVPELPELPLLSHVTDNPEASIDIAGAQMTEDVGASQPLLKDSGTNRRRPQSRISFMNRCVRATKSFFLLSSEGNLYDEIDNQIYLNGQITTVPRKGITVYEIIWDTSSLPHLVINESQLRRTISREDKEMVSHLKRARVLFDEVYPDGPTTGFLSVRKARNKRKVGQKSSGVSQQSTISDNDASIQGPSLTSMPNVLLF